MMKLLIVEDEIHIANHLEKLIGSIPSASGYQVFKVLNFDDAVKVLEKKGIDLLLLDLNLRGKDGFDLLKYVASAAFHTIVVSAYKNRAIEAFEHGVLDFIPKPFNKERLEKAFQKIENQSIIPDHPVRYFGVKRGGSIKLIKESLVEYFEACEHFSKIHLQNGAIEIHDKSLARLTPILAGVYFRIHKKYLVKIASIESLKVKAGGKYSAELRSGVVLPIGRSRYKKLAALVV